MKRNYSKLLFFTLTAFFPIALFAQVWENVGPTAGISASWSGFNNLAKDADGNLYASYYDGSVEKGSVQKFDGTNWTYLGGSPGITQQYSNYNSLAVKDSQNIYFSNKDGGLNVKKFNGTSWETLSNAESATVNYQSIVIDNDGIVYVGSTRANGTVKRYINGAWERVGTAGFNSVNPDFIKLKTGTNGKIYAAFINGGNVHVYENDLTAPTTQSWSAVGGVANIAPSSNGENYNCSLAIDVNNHLYLAYVSGNSGGQKLNVKKFNGNSWQTIGAENFSTGRVQHVSIAVTATGTPYVACSNWENTDFLKNSVYGFNGESWEKMGGFASTGEATYNSLIIDNNEDLVLGFEDSAIDKMVVKRFNIEIPITKYCEVKFPQNTEPITQVTFSGISNSSTSTISSSTPAYEDFTTLFGNVDLGGTYPISVSGNNDTNTINNFSNHIVAYFDWNHNGLFSDAGEVYYLGYIQGNASISTLTGNITVPADAKTGNTRMRIIKKYYSTKNQSIANSCNTTGYGQAEDYMITVYKKQVVVNEVNVSVLNNEAAAITTLEGNLQLVKNVLPSDSNQNVTWSITSGADFATISSGGLVTAKRDGTVIVKVSSVENPALFAEITLSISNQEIPETCNFATLALTGFNADIVADGTGGDTNAKTSSIVDAANVFYSKDFVPANPDGSANSAAQFGGGLPVNGTISSASIRGLTYQFADYTANNALILRNNVTNSGTLTLSSPKKAQKIYVASVSAEGTNTVTVTANFDDNTTQIFTIDATDWWQDAAPSNRVITGLGRISRGASWTPLNKFDGLSQTGIYQNELILDSSNQQKSIVSLTFNQTPPSGNGTTTAILAVSICESPDNTATEGPVVITSGFNHDIIANGVGNASASTTVGFDEANTRALVSLDFKATASSAAPAFGLPADGKINSAAHSAVTFQLANYTGSNALFLTPSHVGNNAANSGTLTFSAANVGKLHLLTAAASGGSNGLQFTATINFSDATTQLIDNVSVSDWYEGSNYAIQGIGRVNIANNNLEGDSTNPRLYDVVLNVDKSNQSKTISGVHFNFAGDADAEYASQIRMSVLAISTTKAITDVLTITTANNVPSVITVKEGTLDLKVSLNNQTITASGVDWTIEQGSTFATIDTNGKVKAIANGTVKVKAALKTDPEVFTEIQIAISGQPKLYCESYFINGCENLSIISVATSGATTNLNNTSSGCIGSNNLNGYSDFTDKVLTTSVNSSMTFNVHFAGSLAGLTFLSVWIDWNQDFVFDDNEMIYVSQAEEASKTLQFTTSVPSNAVPGATRMRLKAVGGWVGSGACGFNSQGETEDYTVNVETEKLGTDDFDKASFTIYPNPTSDFATIQASEPVKEVTVFNISGQQVYKGKSSVIDFSNVQQGLYLVQIVFENGTNVIQKIIRK